MRVIVINPITKTIEERGISGPPYAAVKALIGNWIQSVQIDAKNTIWVDEEGLLNPNPKLFVHRGYSQPLAGVGVITGLTRDGDFASTKLSLDAVIDAVTFAGNLQFVGFEDSTYEVGGVTVFSRKAIFK